MRHRLPFEWILDEAMRRCEGACICVALSRPFNRAWCIHVVRQKDVIHRTPVGPLQPIGHAVAGRIGLPMTENQEVAAIHLEQLGDLQVHPDRRSVERRLHFPVDEVPADHPGNAAPLSPWSLITPGRHCHHIAPLLVIDKQKRIPPAPLVVRILYRLVVRHVPARIGNDNRLQGVILPPLDEVTALRVIGDLGIGSGVENVILAVPIYDGTPADPIVIRLPRLSRKQSRGQPLPVQQVLADGMIELARRQARRIVVALAQIEDVNVTLIAVPEERRIPNQRPFRAEMKRRTWRHVWPIIIPR